MMKFPEKYRIHPSIGSKYNSETGDMFGAFVAPGPCGRDLRIIAAAGFPETEGWEHVSVHADKTNKCPNWEEMCFVKELFWDDEDIVVQFHPPKSKYVNVHNKTLHLWRHPDQKLPPTECV